MIVLQRLIMEFIKTHKSFLFLSGAIAASAGLALLLFKGRSSATAFIEQPLQPVEEILGSDFQSKILVLRNKIQAEGVSNSILGDLSKALADLMVERESESLREDYYKTKQMREKQNYASYAKEVLGWLKDRETLLQSLYREQSQLIASCGLTEEQIQQVYLESERLIDDCIKSKLTEEDVNITQRVLSLKISFLRQKGERLFDEVGKECSGWDQSSLQKLPAILSIIINQEIYTQHPELIEKIVQISWSFQKRQQSLEDNLNQWDELIAVYYESLQKSVNEKRS